MANNNKKNTSSGGEEFIPVVSKTWKIVRGKLASAVGDPNYVKWIADLSVVAVDEEDKSVILVARDPLTAERVNKDYLRLINAAWSAQDSKYKVRVVAREEVDPDLLKRAADTRAVIVRDGEGKADRQTPVRVSHDMSLDTLIVGEANRNAANFVKAFVRGQASLSGTVVLIGPNGAGKTHLLKGIESAFVAAGRGDEVIYITAHEFLSSYVTGVRAGDTSALKARVRGASVVLFDDLHVICGKNGTERELFETLRTITTPDANGQHGQVFVACDQPLNQIDGLGQRLRSDLQGGMVIEMGMPDETMMREIVASKAEMVKAQDPRFELTPVMIDRIVDAAEDGPRVATGIVLSIHAEASFSGLPITADLVESVVSRHVGAPVVPTVDEVKRATAEVFGVSKAVIDSKSRLKADCYPRHVAMYVAVNHTHRSLPLIGRAMGGKHHTSVLHGQRRIAALLETGSPDVVAELRRMISRIVAIARKLASQRLKGAK